MRIQCDVCEKAVATTICCADEAALCDKCDVQIHSANKLASKHQRLLLQNLSSKLPFCDICQEKSAFIFCVNDRALFCRDCDESIHVEGTLSGDHQRILATGIGVALSSSHKTSVLPYKDNSDSKNLTPEAVQQQAIPIPVPIPSTASVPVWSVDEFLQLSDYETSDMKGGESPCMDFGGLDWFADIQLFPEDSSSLAAAEVPVLKLSASPPTAHYKQQLMQQQQKPKYYSGNSAKKPKIDFSDEDNDLLTVPDLGILG